MDSLLPSEWFPYVTLDWVIIGVLVALVGVDSLWSGSRRAAALALAFPVGAFLFIHIGAAWGVGKFVASIGGVGKAITFIVLVTILFLYFTRYTESYDGGGLIHAALVGAATAAVVIASWLSVQPLLELWHPNAAITAIFGDAYRFWWFFIGLAILSFVRR